MFQSVHRLVYGFRPRPAGHMASSEPHPRYDSVQSGSVFIEKSTTLVGDLEQLPRAVGSGGTDLLHFFEQGEGGVDRTGARGIGAAEFLLNFFDELVAVAWLLGDEREEHQAQVAGSKDTTSAAAAPKAAASTGPVTG